MNSRVVCGLALWLTLCLVTAAVAQQPVPAKAGPVVDLTNTLSAVQHQRLAEQLRQFEQHKGSQIYVLIVPSTRPESDAEYALRVAEAWQPGRPGVDDGLVLLVAKDDRRLRIETGYGLEGAIPDAVARRVISEIIAPHFKRGEFFAGLEAGVQRLIGLVDGEPLPEPEWAGDSVTQEGAADNPVLLPLILFLFPLAPLLGRSIGRLPAALLSGAVLGGLGYFAAGLVVGLILAVFGVLVAFNTSAGRSAKLPRPRPRRWPGDGLGGVYTGGRGRSGGFGGGGFRGGGGGGFGGGGASGSW